MTESSRNWANGGHEADPRGWLQQQWWVVGKGDWWQGKQKDASEAKRRSQSCLSPNPMKQESSKGWAMAVRH